MRIKEVDKSLVLLLVVFTAITILGFIAGWLFPVEGPLDYLYDNWASQPAHKSPTKAAPLKPYQVIIDVNELSEEDFEALQEVFRNR